MADDKYYKSNSKSYCVRIWSDGSCKIWNASNDVIGEVKTLAEAYAVIKADSGGKDITAA
jgi:hypothetical protein